MSNDQDAAEAAGAEGELDPAASSRRRSIGSGSARSLLLTVLGEFVYPSQQPQWTTTLIAGLAALGVEEKSARQAIARTAADGILVSRRSGRWVQWQLTEPGAQLLADGTRRIYSFLQTAEAWDGRWLVVSVAIPESQRRLRHRVRTRLTWLGLGSPSAGLWVVPSAAKRQAVAEVIAEAGLCDNAFAWVGDAAGIGDVRRLIARAWSLAEVESRYADFLERFADLTARDDAQAFDHQVQLIQSWRRFPFLDPALPPELLDHDWIGSAAAEVFHRKHDELARAADRYWSQLVGS